MHPDDVDDMIRRMTDAGRFRQAGRHVAPSDLTVSQFGEMVQEAVQEAADPTVRRSEMQALRDTVGDLTNLMRDVGEGVLRNELQHKQVVERFCDAEARVTKSLDGMTTALKEQGAKYDARFGELEERQAATDLEISTAKAKVSVALAAATAIGAAILWIVEHGFDLYKSLKGQ